MAIDFFDEFLDDEGEELGPVNQKALDKQLSEGNYGNDGYLRHIAQHSRKLKEQRARDKTNEVGICPEVSTEILEKREYYKTNFVNLHRDIFPDSTGMKPFGEKQILSIEFGQDIFNTGTGRLLKLEPRGYAKTTRITNEATYAGLSGMQEYIVIVCSSLEKSYEIIESIKTELYNNDHLLHLFPGPVGCFRHLGDNPHKCPHQTYGGNKTYIGWGKQEIQFPCVPNEPSSGCIIEARPMTNLKGLHKKIDAGPNVGKIYRPTLFLFDDPQTHTDAKSPATVKSIIAAIKRDALRGGSHHRRAAAIMAITPVAPGDVAWHFAKEEHSWDIIDYKMLEQRPDNEDWWLEDYAKVYLNYDRRLRGDRTRAALEAKALLEDNWDYAHEGAKVTWDHAFGWDEEPQTEVSPVQHAYNIILDDGIEDFEFECQCNIEYGTYDEGEQIHAPISRIITKTLPYKRTQVPQDTAKMVAHIDVNKEILTYAVVGSPPVMKPHIIDYGTWPQQPGLFSKRRLTVGLSRLYPELGDYREVLYKGIKELISSLMEREYIREDGVRVEFARIGVDIRYEDVYTTRAIIESIHRPTLRGCWGVGVDPDDDLLHEKNKANAISVFENCYIQPNKRRTLDVLNFDSNFFKTELHKGFNLEEGVKGSVTLFGKESDGTHTHPDRHLPFAQHCNSEAPKRVEGKKKRRTRIVWEEKMHQADNEFFDNAVNCLALLVSEGIQLSVSIPSPQKKQERKQDMKDFLNQQRGKSLL